MNESKEKKVLELLERKQYNTTKDISQSLRISDSTTRRLLDKLQAKGLITRTHGGAKINSSDNLTPSFNFRFHQNPLEKKKIALSAIKLIKNGDIVFLDGSTSAFYLAEYLKEFENIKVITNGIDTLSVLAKNNIPAYSTGGQVSLKNPSVLIGRYAEDLISNFHADVSFFSARAINENGEIYDCFEEETFIRRAMIKNSKINVFLCDNSKIGKTCQYRVCSLNEVDYVSSDQPLPDFIPQNKKLTFL